MITYTKKNIYIYIYILTKYAFSINIVDFEVLKMPEERKQNRNYFIFNNLCNSKNYKFDSQSIKTNLKYHIIPLFNYTVLPN